MQSLLSHSHIRCMPLYPPKVGTNHGDTPKLLNKQTSFLFGESTETLSNELVPRIGRGWFVAPSNQKPNALESNECGISKVSGTHVNKFVLASNAILFVIVTAASTPAQEQFASPSQSVRTQNGANSQSGWQSAAASSLFPNSQSIQVDLPSLFALALSNSEQIKIYSETPLIRETAVVEANATFDWTRYFNGLWEDTDEPVGSSLTVGGAGTRFQDQNLSLTGGVRRRSLTGVEVDLSQRIGHQDTNSNFFIPNDQATAQLALNVNIPLLRGRGRAYNTSLQCLAHIDVQTANDEFHRQLQSHLLEITRAYWALYLERASFAQRYRLAHSTSEILKRIERRRTIDASPVQLTSAKAALSARESELIRASAAIRNAEARLRALINAPDLGIDETTELIPVQPPSGEYYYADLSTQVETALQSRPEIQAATKEIKAAAIRLNMSKHEILPVLNLVTRGYLSGLRGNSEFRRSFSDQFSTGRPSYSVGIEYEVPINNRAAKARLQRRKIEKRQLESQFRLTIQNVTVEVEVAVRELLTALKEVGSRQTAVNSAEAEVAALENRWNEMVTQNGSASLTLESLLRSQERLTDAEFELAEAQLTYNLAIMNLNVANGSLLETENIGIGRSINGYTPSIIVEKAVE